MKKVVATGVFGILHPGHLLFLREAKKLGDRLIVIVASDDTVKRRKGKILIPEKQRLEMIRALKLVDDAVLGDKKNIFRPIEKIKPDVIALGKNQDIDENFLKEGLKKRKLKAKIIRIKKHLDTESSSTQKIIQKIRAL